MNSSFLSKIAALVLVLHIGSINYSNAQALSGNYTIDPTTGDYTSFSSAVEALNTEGIAGPVVFSVCRHL